MGFDVREDVVCRTNTTIDRTVSFAIGDDLVDDSVFVGLERVTRISFFLSLFGMYFAMTTSLALTCVPSFGNPVDVIFRS
jgi:hypothetical protein